LRLRKTRLTWYDALAKSLETLEPEIGAAMLDVNRIRAVCFDVDGTLNDTDDLAVEKLARTLNRLRFLLPGRDAPRVARRLVMWVEAPGNAVIGVPDWLGIDDNLAFLFDWLNRNNANQIQRFRLMEGVPELLEALHGRYHLAIVSARDEGSTRQFLRAFDLEKYFVCVAGALTVEHTKPYPDPIFWAAQQMGVPASNCLMIGDTTVDIRAGKAAGAQTAGVLCGFGERAELVQKGADVILDTTAQLLDVLK
jgi:N-acetyl-D-muramate 6-phosphate phosphatase